jgi:predicted regulator of Ras-like GTPase activity (Roadblock/LC7/MglB family)
MPNGVKTRFAGLLRELLRRFDENETGAEAPSVQPQPAVQSAPPPPERFQQTAPPQPKPVAVPSPAPAENISDLELPLPSVLQNLPPQLRTRVRLASVDLSRATISISVSKIMPQLAVGVVKITFGELRHAAPSLFDVDEEYDSLPVVLPLNEVLAHLNSQALVRNPARKLVEVPADITGPFNERGEGISISATLAKPPPQLPPKRINVPAASAPAKTPPPVAPPPPSFVPRAIKPEPQIPSVAHSGNGNGNGNGSSNGNNGNGLPVRPLIPTIPIQSISPVAPKPAVPMPEQATILAPLAALSENWPEALQMEIAPLTTANAQVALPVNLVEPALKRGRVIFAWRNLRSWIKPMPLAVSIHDGIELELPLKVIAPLFLARQTGAAQKIAKSQQQSTSLPAEIPNLFFGFPQPQPPHEIPEPFAKTPAPDETRFAPVSPIAPKPVEAQRPDTNYYIWVESDTTRLAARPTETDFKREMPPATDFSSRHATPKEVVARAMALNDVAGVLVALPDGLMVASEIPAELNPDTLAAFLPQIYGRVSQCTKELRMGELNNLTFTVGNVPWKIFRVNGVYFAAFGRAGEQLPTTQLVQLAGELNRKKQ